MKCSSCQRENSSDAAFCSQCGTRLGASCPACGRAADPDAAFCSGCGQRLRAAADSREDVARAATPPHLAAKILRDRARLEGEHRTVTVLFIDAVGSVATGERIDQEELHRITREATERMVSAVHRFEGTVAQFRGDGIMALFGAPIAHEDSARRAIASAIAMRDSLAGYDRELRLGGSAGFTYRIGLHTGPVIVGRIGDDLSMDYTAIGDTVNLAARMEQWAAPGSIYVTEQTRRLAAGYFDFADLGALEVKGKREAVRAFEVERELASRTRLDVAVERGLTPYIGRTHELSLLRSHFEQAQQGRGQVVFISGEAGMGKSRLMLEFRQTLEGQDFTWLTGQCISYGRNIPYLPIVDLLKRGFGVEETDDDTAIIARIDERAETWDEAGRRSVPYVKFLMNVDPGDETVGTMDPLERRAGILDALRAMLVRGSGQRPVVVLIEDLHWIDEKSEEALAALVEVTAAARVLMILTYRPGYAPSLGDRSYYNRISLQHLPLQESDAFLEGVLPAGDCPELIRRLITGKAEGNPFYLEEVTKSLVESGMIRVRDGAYELTRPADEVHIPQTIQEVILTRIDRLDREAKDAIQLASVIGREFTVRLLARMSEAEHRLDSLLGELKALELIYEKAYFPELSYMFKHALTHDVAYATLLNERRKGLHLIVGAAVEELYADRLAEQYETLAHHYEQGENWPKALDYLVKSAEKAIAAYANEDALAFYARAMDAAAHCGPQVLERVAEIATARGWIGLTVGNTEGTVADFDRAVRAARERGDRHAEGLALVTRCIGEIYHHDFDAAQATIDEAFAIAEEGHPDVDFGANFGAGMWHMLIGGSKAGLPYLEAAERLSRGEVDPATYSMFRSVSVVVPHWTGHYDQAVVDIERGQEFVEGEHQLMAVLEHAWIEAMARSHRGEYEQALAIYDRLLAICERVGEQVYKGRLLNCVGWIYGEIENYELAERYNERSLESALKVGGPDPEVEMNARLNLADNAMALGRLDESAEQLKVVERVVREPSGAERWMLWRYSQHYYHSCGELHLVRGDAETAIRLAETCLRLAEETDAPKNVVKALRLRGQARMVLGDLAAAEEDIAAARAIAVEIGNPGQLLKTHVALGDVLLARNRQAHAGVAYRDALGVIERVAASLSDTESRDAFLSSAAVRRVKDRVETCP